MHEIAHAQKRNPLSDLDDILQDGRYSRRNHVGKFWWRLVKGFRGGGGQILAFPIEFDRRPYNSLALPCGCALTDVIIVDCKLAFFKHIISVPWVRSYNKYKQTNKQLNN